MEAQIAAESTDNLPDQVSVEASLTESGVSFNARSRFVSSLDRMFGGIFEIPAAFMQNRVARSKLLAQLDRDRIEARAKLNLSGELKLKELELAAEYVAQEREARRLLNLGSVAQIALEDLRETGSQDQEFGEAGHISEDWLNWFEGFAAKASSEQVRTLWGKILAGEVRRPGRFSIGTLRTLAEVNQATALLFQKHVDHLLWDKWIIKPEGLKGITLMELSDLEDAGLIREVNGMMGFDHSFDAQGKRYFEQGNIVLELSAPENTSYRLSVILLSRAGCELFSILPQPSPDAALRKIAEAAPTSITSAKLGVILSRTPPDQFQWITTEVLRGQPET